MKRHLIALLLFPIAALAQTPNPTGGLAALHALPAKYQHGILKLSADNGKPNPKKWYIVANDRNNISRNFIVEDGRVSNESSGFMQDIRSAVTGLTPINLSKVNIDNIGAWHAAEKYAASKGTTLGSASYALTQKGKNATPMWQIWAYTRHGSEIGYLVLLATDGTVINSD